MKFTRAVCALFLSGSAIAGSVKSGGDRAITQVVKLLQDILEKSQAEGKTERTIYGKYKCYCDTTEESKTSEIDGLTKTIDLLESRIADIQASTGVLSKEVAKLNSDIAANVQARSEAQAIRDKEKADFDALQTDLVGAIGQMTAALETLSAIGADQTLSSGADHAKFLGGYSDAAMLKLKTRVQQALVAASAFVDHKQLKAVQSLLQAPFTGTYTSQAGEVVGILKNMLDTFKDNLATATSTESAALAAFTKYMANAILEHTEMEQAYNSKQAQLAANDDELSGKKTILASSVTQKGEAETFLSQLVGDCAAKAKEYDHRVALRQSEQAAVSEAISILNSDEAFASFGKVAATTTGATGPSFLQRSVIRQHSQASQDHEARRTQARDLLWKATGGRFSLLAKVAALLEANNPFSVVLKEIEKIVALIAEEEKADDAKLAFCNSERETSATSIAEKTAAIDTLQSAIDELSQAIENPTTGLKVTIANSEAALQTNLESQAQLTKARHESTAAYKSNVENLVEAEALLTKAIDALNKFYSQIIANEESLLQKKGGKQQKKDEPPATWEGNFQGQSEHSNNAIEMLNFILTNTKTEENTAHEDEAANQSAYETAMETLKGEQTTLLETLAEQKMELASKESDLLGSQEDHKKTSADKAAVEAYVASIKPGCDFITLNIEERKESRQSETEALNKAAELLKDTPAFKAAVAAAHQESLGECAPTCAGKEEHVDCKACLAKVSVPGYCAGHPGTEGCA